MKNVLAVFIGMYLFDFVNGAIAGYVSGLPSYAQAEELMSWNVVIVFLSVVIYAVLCMRSNKDESKPREVSSEK